MRFVVEVSGSLSGPLPDRFPERAHLALAPVVEELVREHCREGVIPDDVFLSIEFIDEEGMRELNMRFLGEDSPTDVLAFPIYTSDGGFSFPGDIPACLLGDIVVCLPKVEENALQAGHPFLRELSLVLVHGLLHLFGLDHDTEERRTNMWRTQELYWDTIEHRLSFPAGPERNDKKERIDQ